MRQAVLTQPGAITIRQVDRPVIDQVQVLIQVRCIGICGSDMHVFHGQHPLVTYPFVQGHEMSGTVVEVGAQVHDVALGDTIVLMPQVTCGVCYPCRHGQYHICDQLKVMGFQVGGAAQDYFAVSETMVVRIPERFSLDAATLIEPSAVAVHALSRAGNIADKKVVVLGAGTIGNLVGQVAQALGAADVLITDVSIFKLEKAHACGIHHVVNTRTEDLDEAVLRAFGPDRADVVLECVGSEQTLTQAVACARKGSTIVVVGGFGHKPVIDIGLIQDRELTLCGTLMYQRCDFEQAILLAEGGHVRFDQLITHRFAFDDYLTAYKAIDNSEGRTMKVLLEL